MPPDAPPSFEDVPQADFLAQTLKVVGERWSFLILRDMWVLGPRRFGQLQRSLRIARNVLTGRLQTLMAGGVVDRTVYQAHPPRFDYFLTPEGEGLVPPLMLLATWGDRHLSGPAGPPMLLGHRNHGHLADPVTVCRHCGEELTIHTLEAIERSSPGSES